MQPTETANIAVPIIAVLSLPASYFFHIANSGKVTRTIRRRVLALIAGNVCVALILGGTYWFADLTPKDVARATVPWFLDHGLTGVLFALVVWMVLASPVMTLVAIDDITKSYRARTLVNRIYS